MNPKLDFIFGRRSIRKFQDKPVEDSLINDILQAAMAAPSAVAKDPWRFVVVTDHTMLDTIAEGLPNGQMLKSAPLGIVVCGDIEKAHDNQLSYLLQDCSAAIQNILLAAHILGLGACWLGVHPRKDRIEHLLNVLHTPESVLPVACIAIGYRGEEKESRTRYNENYIHRENW